MPIYEGDIDRSDLSAVDVDPLDYGKLYPCDRCASWFVTVDRYDDLMVIREWHDKACPNLPPAS